VPIKTYSPYSIACPTCPPASLCAACSFWCGIFGNITPFSQATLKSLYNNHGFYLARFTQATIKMLNGRWVTGTDMGLMIAGAAQSNVLR
jgi:hypothetical protein